MSFGDDTLDPANETTRARPSALATPAALQAIQVAIIAPSRFAYREMGESDSMFRARAVSNRLIYDDEELHGMGLDGGTPAPPPSYTRAREADDTREFTAAERAEAEDPDAPVEGRQPIFTTMRIPPEAPITYSWRLPQLTLVGALSLSLSVVAFVLALIALAF